MEHHNRVYAEVDLNCIRNNFNALAALTNAECQLFAVIKADGYGHGAVPIAKALEKEEKLYGFAVATAEEAIELRQHHIAKPIVVLGYTFEDSYEQLAKYQIMPTVFREDSLEALSKAAQQAGKPIKVHVKVDTGMHRIGVTPDERGLAFMEKLLHTDGIVLDGLFTHFARADEVDKTNTEEQFAKFMNFANMAEARFQITIPCKHCANSAAILEFPKSHLNFARIGVALYGMWPSDEIRQDTAALRPALSLYSHIVYIKEIQKGDCISYGGTFLAEHPMKVATIPVGYGDGYPRSLSSKGYVLIRGQKAPILGRVCMDQCMVDVTHIPDASMGDLVTLIGTDGMETIAIEELGDLSGRFNYELACNLNKRIPREYIGE